MEPNNDSSGLSSYYHHSQLHHQTPLPSPPTSAAATNSFPINAVLPNNTTTNNSGLVYPHTVPSAVSSPPETVKRKRGRPRKYGTPEQAAAAKRLSGLASSAASPKKRGQSLAAAVTIGSSASSSKKSQLASFGIIGQGFTPHVISVAAGEDVGQKIMSFVQQSKREICIMSASGSVSIACLHQPATSGGSVTYEGLFDILSLSGSYTCTELGGRTGGLRVCLSSVDGHIIGGGVGGPLTAAGPIQVIVGTFLVDTKKDVTGKPLSPIGGASASGLSFRSSVDSHHQTVGGSQYMIQHQSMQLTPSHAMEWRDAHQSPENSDYEPVPE
ncbi:AT-hook motif nuclear-localized protein 14-like [Olea europaea var. sylvestris]|uniref:AT-hook motif nuclear-localized protein 14-like n=1 Tax=Olea europaea var. sylvestris TaxID=158386 RepID=UPI000C1CF0F1|nr:AT-hook motif nuclear-localized protein 14-like [Olea europaea var. sylvestris]